MDGVKLRRHGGNITEVAKKYGPASYLDFSANINPLGLAPAVERAIRENLRQVQHYPEPDAHSTNAEIGRYLGVESDFMITGNGASELIYLLTRLISPRRVIIPQPTFSEYQLAAKSAGADIVPLPLLPEEEFRWDERKIIAALSRGDMLFICNPNNPVGNLMNREQLMTVLEACESAGKYLVVDESFADFVRDMPSLVKRVPEYRSLIVIYSLTKFFALPGLRLGCLAAPPGIVQGIGRLRDPWSVNALAQIAGRVAVKQKDYIEETRLMVEAEAKFLYDELKRFSGVRPYPPAANYVFIDIRGTGQQSSRLRERLIKEGVIVRDCSTYPTLGQAYIRVAVRKHGENIRLLQALKKSL